MLDSRESATYDGKGSVLVQQSCVPLPFSYAQQSAAPMIASSRSPLDRQPRFFSFLSPSRAPPSKLAYREATLCVHEIKTPSRIRQRIGRIGKAPRRLCWIALEGTRKGYPTMTKLFSTCAALLSLATMPVVGIAQSGSTQISITPTSSQKVIAGAQDRFTGTVRAFSLSSTRRNQPGRAVARLRSSPERDRPGTPIRLARS